MQFNCFKLRIQLIHTHIHSCANAIERCIAYFLYCLIVFAAKNTNTVCFLPPPPPSFIAVAADDDDTILCGRCGWLAH